MAVAELRAARICGLQVAVSEWGLVKGYVAIATGEQALKFVELKDAQAAIDECAKNAHWPKANTIFCHDGPGELAALLNHFKENA